MKRLAVLVVFILFTLSGCSFPKFLSSYRIVQHPAPDLKVDNTYFAERGCFNSPACLPEDLQKSINLMGTIYEVPDVLGGLSPSIPLAMISFVGLNPEFDFPAVYVRSCMAQQYIRYLAGTDDGIILIDSVSGLADLFAPIDSKDEALSYAVAATGLTPLYDLEKSTDTFIHPGKIEETYVKEIKDGYLVHLFNTYLCGCGPHVITSVDVTVNPDGSISLSEPVEAYSDSSLDGLCID